MNTHQKNNCCTGSLHRSQGGSSLFSLSIEVTSTDIWKYQSVADTQGFYFSDWLTTKNVDQRNFISSVSDKQKQEQLSVLRLVQGGQRSLLSCLWRLFTLHAGWTAEGRSSSWSSHSQPESRVWGRDTEKKTWIHNRRENRKLWGHTRNKKPHTHTQEHLVFGVCVDKTLPEDSLSHSHMSLCQYFITMLFNTHRVIAVSSLLSFCVRTWNGVRGRSLVCMCVSKSGSCLSLNTCADLRTNTGVSCVWILKVQCVPLTDCCSFSLHGVMTDLMSSGWNRSWHEFVWGTCCFPSDYFYRWYYYHHYSMSLWSFLRRLTGVRTLRWNVDGASQN